MVSGAGSPGRSTSPPRPTPALINVCGPPCCIADRTPCSQAGPRSSCQAGTVVIGSHSTSLSPSLSRLEVHHRGCVSGERAAITQRRARSPVSRPASRRSRLRRGAHRIGKRCSSSYLRFNKGSLLARPWKEASTRLRDCLAVGRFGKRSPSSSPVASPCPRWTSCDCAAGTTSRIR